MMASPPVLNVPVHATGTVAIDFHGDPATGCAAAGLCGATGTIAVTPAGDGQIILFDVRAGTEEVTTAVGFLDSSTVTARVKHAGGGTCTDAVPAFVQFAALPTIGGSLTLGLRRTTGAFGGADWLTTRCGGALEADVDAALPQVRVPVKALRRGRGRLDLSTTRDIAAGGLAGTVRSDLRLALRRPRLTVVLRRR